MSNGGPAPVSHVASTLPCEICGAATMSHVLRHHGRLTQCTDCGHLTRSLADAPAGARDAAYGGDPTLDTIRLGLTHRELRRGGPFGRVFEIGYGHGSLLRRFADEGAQVAGIDVDQLGVDVDEHVRSHGDLRVGRIEDLSDQDIAAIPQGDLTFGVHVIEHVDDPAATMRAAARLTRPGGLVRMLTPAGDSTQVDLYGAAWWMLEDPTHVRFFTADSIGRLAEQAGLTDIEVTRPLLDSVSVDAASAVRALRPRRRPAGVLGQRSTMALALATLPLVGAARVASPRMRPTILLTARVPEAPEGLRGEG